MRLTKTKRRSRALMRHILRLQHRANYVHLKSILGLIDGRIRPCIIHAVDFEGLDARHPQGPEGLVVEDLLVLGIKREFGLAVLDTRDITMTPEHSKEYFTHIMGRVRGVHMLLKEFADCWNTSTGKEIYAIRDDSTRRQVPHQFRFGETEISSISEWSVRMATHVSVAPQDSDVQHVFLQHGGHDFEVLQRHNVRVDHYTRCMDSMEMMGYARGNERGARLRNCMHWFQEDFSWAHNAGNDAMFCLQVAVALACQTELGCRRLGVLTYLQAQGSSNATLSWDTGGIGLEPLWDMRIMLPFVDPTDELEQPEDNENGKQVRESPESESNEVKELDSRTASCVDRTW